MYYQCQYVIKCELNRITSYSTLTVASDWSTVTRDVYRHSISKLACILNIINYDIHRGNIQSVYSLISSV